MYGQAGTQYPCQRFENSNNNHDFENWNAKASLYLPSLNLQITSMFFHP